MYSSSLHSLPDPPLSWGPVSLVYHYGSVLQLGRGLSFSLSHVLGMGLVTTEVLHSV